MVNRAYGNTDISEMCNIRIQFLYTEIDTFPFQGIHHGCVFNYTWRDESDKVIEDTPLFIIVKRCEDTGSITLSNPVNKENKAPPVFILF